MSRLNFVLMGKLLYLIKIKQKNFMYKDLLILCSTIGVKLGEACTIVLRGATKQILDEADRSIHDALCVLTQTVKETKIVFGGGNIWISKILATRTTLRIPVSKLSWL